jgi:hypothetical protein
MDPILIIVIVASVGVIFASIAAYLGAKNGQNVTMRFKKQITNRHTMLDKRLEIHQKAFYLSLELPAAAHNPNSNSDLLHQCDRFWKTNCLFMVPKVRESFRIAYHTAWFYASYKDKYEKGEISDNQLKEEWHKITKATHDIVESVGFKWLGNLEPINKEHNYLRRASDWQNQALDRRRRQKT